MELRIKEVLREKGITAISLASKLGIAQPSMSNIVNGKSKPSLDTLEKIAEILNIPISELFEKPESDTITCPNCGKKFRMEQ